MVRPPPKIERCAGDSATYKKGKGVFKLPLKKKKGGGGPKNVKEGCSATLRNGKEGGQTTLAVCEGG